MHRHGCVNYPLIQERIVAVYDTANHHRCAYELFEEIGVLLLHCSERGSTGDEGILAFSLETVPTLDLDWMLLMRMIDVWKQDLICVIFGESSGSLLVLLMV